MKNIAICCDGTGNEFGQNNTNVVETYLALEKDEDQIAYYDPGVGTGGWEYQEERGELRAMGDKATGQGLQKNVEDAYRFLADHYEEGESRLPVRIQSRRLHGACAGRNALQVRIAARGP